MSLIDAKDRETVEKITLGETRGGSLGDLQAHAILEGIATRRRRNRVVVRDQLGDARAFSLDSPKSRQPNSERCVSWRSGRIG
jgi:hypothetical protein